MNASEAKLAVEIVEMWGAGGGAGTVGDGQQFQGGVGPGIDPDLMQALGDLIRKLNKKKRKVKPTLKPAKPGQMDQIVDIVDKILTVKKFVKADY